jgi:hypothetical protein
VKNLITADSYGQQPEEFPDAELSNYYNAEVS